MYCLEQGEVMPGEGVGVLKLGMRRETVERIMADYYAEKRATSEVYSAENVMVWINDSDDRVSQILVYGNFRGKFLGEFGIGSMITDIEKKVNAKAKEDLDVFIFDCFEGIGFGLEDFGGYDKYEPFVMEEYLEWYKARAAIEFISVF